MMMMMMTAETMITVDVIMISNAEI